MNDTKKFVLPELPYNTSDLSPTISSQTVDLHYGKHHQAYFNMLNTFAEGTKFMDMDLDEVVGERSLVLYGNAGKTNFLVSFIKKLLLIVITVLNLNPI